jgi:GR25 family glycosyltransferase involved in LPS biosynthesis
LKFQLKTFDSNHAEKVELENFKIRNVVVSLKLRADRRIYIQNQFDDLEIPFVFLDAIHGKTQKAEIDKIIKISSNSAKYLPAGSLGCIASHITLWKELIESQYDGYLIFEDDVVIQKNYHEIEALIRTIPIDFDLVYFGSGSYKSRLNMKKVSDNIFKPFSIRRGAYCYLISKKGASTIIESVKEVKITCGGIDTILGILTMRNKINTYHIYPSICNVNLDSPSNIYNYSFPSKILYKTEY